MVMRKLLTGTALTTTLAVGLALPAAAGVLPIGGYTGPLQLNFNNYESFLTTSGKVSSTPAVGDENFGIFSVQSISVPGPGGKTLYFSGENGVDLLGVFNGITVASVTNPGAFNEKTTNTGGVFELFSVSSAQFTAAGGDQGTAGYANASCAIASLCYNGITNEPSSTPILTMTLVPGVDGPSITLTAIVNGLDNPATGEANFDGSISGDPQFALSPNAKGKDSFCANTTASGCAGADNSSFVIASQDPITATAVPEPGSLGLLGTGLLFASTLWRRRRRRS